MMLDMKPFGRKKAGDAAGYQAYGHYGCTDSKSLEGGSNIRWLGFMAHAE